MGLTTGTRFGPYEIADAIGAGGMGEVYRARDTTLDRVVAIKVLPSTFSTDAARVMRFEQEAKTLAALNHANIAQIYGLERSGGTTALVMELVDGITLAERIAQEPPSVDEALAIAAQIAAALEAAHERRIVHRDLKPANVKLRADGTVKVLDFGIAKALDPREASGSQPAALTTPAMTEAGVMLGTAAYMSPEQTRGKAIDQRADIWAFGCVLYEMLTGRSPFGDEDVMGTLAHVLDRDPDFEALPRATPAAVRQTLRLCLRKDPRERIADIRDVRLALKGAFETRSGKTATSRPRSVWPVAAAVVLGAVASGLVAWSRWPEPEPRAVNRFLLPIPAEHRFQGGGLPVIDIAADGRSFLYHGAESIYLRRLGELEARPIAGVDRESFAPFFAPDGDTIAFFASAPVSLKRIPSAGGAPVIVAAIPAATFSLQPRGRWEADGTILYSTGRAIYRVRAEGGEPEPLVEAGAGEVLYGPQLLPSADAVLFTVSTSARDASQIVVQSLNGERKTLHERRQ